MNVPRSVLRVGVVCRSAVAALLLLQSALANADLILTSAPRETAAAGQKEYGPLAAELTKALGVKVTYVHPKGWLYYQRDMRRDKYDIIFDGPHFISWRMHRFNHVPVAKLPGTLSFILFSKKSDKSITSMKDLYNVPTCALEQPNLATLTMLAEYPNPVLHPKQVTVKGGAPGVYKAFTAGKCRAAIIRKKFFMRKIPEAAREKLRILYASVPVTNQGIDVSSRVTPEQRAKIQQILTEPHNKALTMTLKRFGGKATRMIPATPADYENQYRLLTGVIFGWDIPAKDTQSK